MNMVADRNYWLLSSGKDGELWPTFWNDKVVALGWSAVGDLRQYADRDKFREAFRAVHPGLKPGQYRNNVTQLWNFYQGVAKGEVIFVRSYGAIIGVGEVQSDYEYVPASDPLRKRLYSPFFQDDFPHIRYVRWLSLWGGLKQSLTFTRLTLMSEEPEPLQAGPQAGPLVSRAAAGEGEQGTGVAGRRADR